MGNGRAAVDILFRFSEFDIFGHNSHTSPGTGECGRRYLRSRDIARVNNDNDYIKIEENP